MTTGVSFRTLTILLTLTGAIAALSACSAAPGKESTGEYVDSAAITTKVKTAILNEPGLKSMQISVETYKDAVQLSGFVDTASSKYKAEEVVRNVEGVKSVKNDLVVK
jgi:osmotically-inducible protein OsmY